MLVQRVIKTTMFNSKSNLNRSSVSLTILHEELLLAGELVGLQHLAALHLGGVEGHVEHGRVLLHVACVVGVDGRGVALGLGQVPSQT